MILITDVTWQELPGKDRQEVCDWAIDGLRDCPPANGCPTETSRMTRYRELAKGRYFYPPKTQAYPHPEPVCVGVSKRVQDILSLPMAELGCLVKENEQLRTNNRTLLRKVDEWQAMVERQKIITKVIKASFECAPLWRRLKMAWRGVL